MEAKIVSMVSVHCHAHRLTSACYFPAADLYSMVYAVACRGGAKRGAGPGHPRQGGIQRVKLQNLNAVT